MHPTTEYRSRQDIGSRNLAYTDIQELDTATLQRLIKKIVIHEDLDGDIIRQTVEIHFNFKGQPDKYKLIRE